MTFLSTFLKNMIESRLKMKLDFSTETFADLYFTIFRYYESMLVPVVVLEEEQGNGSIALNQTTDANDTSTANQTEANNQTIANQTTIDGNTNETMPVQFEVQQVWVSINESFEFPKCRKQCSSFYVGRLDFEAVDDTMEVRAGDVAEFACKEGFYVEAPEPVYNQLYISNI